MYVVVQNRRGWIFFYFWDKRDNSALECDSVNRKLRVPKFDKSAIANTCTCVDLSFLCSGNISLFTMFCILYHNNKFYKYARGMFRRDVIMLYVWNIELGLQSDQVKQLATMCMLSCFHVESQCRVICICLNSSSLDELFLSYTVIGNLFLLSEISVIELKLMYGSLLNE